MFMGCSMRIVFKNFTLILGLTLLLGLALKVTSNASVNAKNGNYNIPQINGDYPDPEHPGIRVRVFVHQPNNGYHGGGGKPTPTPAPTTCSDDNSTSVVNPAGWQLPTGNWTYRLNLSSVPSSNIDLQTITSAAFGEWENAVSSSTSKPIFQHGDPTTVDKSAYDGQNVIAWGRTQGTALAVTYVRYDTSTNEVVDVDTIMNKKFAWSWTPYNTATNYCGQQNSYDAQDILTHELGHWMGLDDEYDASYANNTMYGYGATDEIKKDTLTTGDISGVNSIY